jgi:hypothetical protein
MKKVGRKWTWANWHLSWHFYGVSEESHENPSQSSQCPNHHSNSAPPKYMSRALWLHQPAHHLLLSVWRFSVWKHPPRTLTWVSVIQSVPSCLFLLDILSHVGVTIGTVLDWILDLLTSYTLLRTTSNYSTIDNLHTSQIARAHTKSLFQPAVSSLIVYW